MLKDYSKSKLSKSRWFCSIGEYKSSWIFKQLEIIGEKFGFKITDAIEKFENAEMIFEWRKENSRLKI
jgi:excinuclease ABC subunit A